MSKMLLINNSINISCEGDLKLTTKYLTKISSGKLMNDIKSKILEKYAKEGARALEESTPKDTGLTSRSWHYEIDDDGTSFIIRWYNTNNRSVSGKYTVNIAAIIRYGHGTKNGGYVRGIDYITPALQPIFDKLVKDAWQEVTSS